MNTIAKRGIWLCLLLLAPAAEAYVGPGAGISLLGSLAGLVGVIVLAIASVVLWPIRRLMRKKKTTDQQAGAVDEDAPSTARK